MPLTSLSVHGGGCNDCEKRHSIVSLHRMRKPASDPRKRMPTFSQPSAKDIL